MNDEGFFAMLDEALEKACAEPHNLGLTQKAWKVIDETVSPKSDGSGSPKNIFEPKPIYLNANKEGVAP